MNKERLEQLWPIMEAFKRGEEICSREHGSSQKWSTQSNPMWLDDYDYIVKTDISTEPFIPAKMLISGLASNRVYAIDGYQKTIGGIINYYDMHYNTLNLNYCTVWMSKCV